MRKKKEYYKKPGKLSCKSYRQNPKESKLIKNILYKPKYSYYIGTILLYILIFDINAKLLHAHEIYFFNIIASLIHSIPIFIVLPIEIILFNLFKDIKNKIYYYRLFSFIMALLMYFIAMIACIPNRSS